MVQLIKLGEHSHKPLEEGDLIAPEHIELSGEEGNALRREDDGLYVPEASSGLPEGGQEDQLLQMGPDGGAVWADLTDLLPAAPLNPEDLPVALGLDEQGNLVWHKIGC